MNSLCSALLRKNEQQKQPEDICIKAILLVLRVQSKFTYLLVFRMGQDWERVYVTAAAAAKSICALWEIILQQLSWSQARQLYAVLLPPPQQHQC